MNTPDNLDAFGAPGIEPRWTSSAKEGLGTAYHMSCRVWFTLSHGIVNEIYYRALMSRTRVIFSFSSATEKRFATRKSATWITGSNTRNGIVCLPAHQFRPQRALSFD